MDIRTIWTIPIVLILATGIPTALAAHSPAYLYGFGLGKNAGLRGYYDVMNECSNRPYLSTNVTGAIKHFTSLQQVNDCDSGYDDGWNKYCHIGLAKHPNPAASCPGISGPKSEIESLNTSGTLPWVMLRLFNLDAEYIVNAQDTYTYEMCRMSMRPSGL